MITSNIKAVIPHQIHKVWDLVFDVQHYADWRSKLSKVEIINERQFIEYTKDGYSTIFTVTFVEPYKRWEFDMENSHLTGHWIGIFFDKGNKTEIDFTECVEVKKWIMKPFVKFFLKKQQKQFVAEAMKQILNDAS